MSVADLVSKACWASRDSHQSRQIEAPFLGGEESTTVVVCSGGVDDDGILARLATESIARALGIYEVCCAPASGTGPGGSGAFQAAPQFIPRKLHPLFFVIVPDAISDEGCHHHRSSLLSAVDAECHKRGSSLKGSMKLHVIGEGSSIKQRTEAYFEGGVVLTSARFFCADVLHKRVDLFSALCGVVMYIPCPERCRSTARQIGKGLPSLAFAAELVFARNCEIPLAASPDGSRQAAPRWPQRAPVFMFSDNPKAVDYCLGSKSVLDGPGSSFLEAFHVQDILVFPRFRLDIVHHLEAVIANGGDGESKKRAPDMHFEFVAIPPAADAVALFNILKTILGEIIAELASTERRLETSWGLATDHTSEPVKLRRTESSVSSGSNATCGRWANASKPCGISFQNLSIPDLLVDETCTDATPASATTGSLTGTARIHIESLLRDELAREKSSVAPYAPLLHCLDDMLYLMDRLPSTTPGTFLLLLDQMVSGDSRFRSARAVQHNEVPEAPMWTLSGSFGDLMQLAAHRVFRVDVADNGLPKEGTNPAVNVVDDDDYDDDVMIVEPMLPHQSEMRQFKSAADTPTVQIHPSLEASDDPSLAALKQQSTSWIDSMHRKTERLLQKDPRVSPPAPQSLLILLESDVAVVRCTRYFISTRHHFVASELQRFVLSYQRLHGVLSYQRLHGVCRREDDGAGMNWGRSSRETNKDDVGGDAADRDARESGGDDEEDHGGVAGVDEIAICTQASVASVSWQHQRAAVDVSTHAALLRFPTQHCDDSITISQEDDDEAVLTQSGILHGAQGGVVYRCTGLSSGVSVLRATRVLPSTTSWSASVRIVNAKRLTAQTLVQLYTEGRWCGEFFEGALPSAEPQRLAPFGRVLLGDTSLRTLRLVESFFDIIASMPLSSAQQLKPPSHGSLKFVCLSTHFADTTRLQEKKAEQTHFSRIVVQKSSFVERMFCSRESLQEVEQDILRSRVRTRGRDADFLSGMTARAESGRIPTSAGAALMKMTLPRRSGKAMEQESTGTAVRRRPLVIFDERECRCPLPYHLYSCGFDVVPLTLLHGDYIVADGIALERKSIPDLIQSLWSGRLGNQLQSLTRQFRFPILLIEFSWSGPFRMVRAGGLQRRVGRETDAQTAWARQQNVQIFRRLSTLLRDNNVVRVLWSRSAQQSAAICKKIRSASHLAGAGEDPDPSDPGLTERKEGEVAADVHYAMRILRTFPGVDGENETRIMDAVGSLAGLALASQETLGSIMGPIKGKMLHEFLHAPLLHRVG